MARVELENSVRFTQKISEPHLVRDRSRDETIQHFLALVKTNSGAILRFEDAGSRWVRIRTSRYPQEPDQ